MTAMVNPPEEDPDVTHALKRIARDEQIRQVVMGNPPVQAMLRTAADRFIGGETLDQCIAVGQTVAASGHAVALDYIGEGPRTEAAANTAAEEFERIGSAIGDSDLDAAISLDLTHVGLTVGREVAAENLRAIATVARTHGAEVVINMEGTEYIDDILAVYEQLCDKFHNVGITLQAYLFRTDEDLEDVLTRPGRVRLVKGAYDEQADTVRPRGEPTDVAYRKYMRRLFEAGQPCEIATHDETLLADAHELLRTGTLDPTDVEFSMLYGVTPNRLAAVRERGHDTRIYLPYGTEWYRYLCHRLAEHPPNVYRALADMGSVPTQ